MKRSEKELIRLEIEAPAHVEQKAKLLAEDAGLSVSEYFGKIVMKTASGTEGANLQEHEGN